MATQGTNVGQIYYECTLDTKKMVDEQRRVDAELQKTSKSLDGFEAKLNVVTQAVKAYAAALFLISQSDAYTKLTAQLKLATDSTRDFEKAQQNVRAIAKEAQTDISGVGTLYARVSQATKELGVSQAKVSDITRTVALALKVSGAGAAESASATLQLSQAFAAGALRGEEFNSVSEAAPRLMQALADGIGVPRGALRKMAEEGKLTSAVLAEALPKALKDLESEAKQVQTISGAFQELRNEVMLFIGEQTNASGASAIVAASISTLAANIDTLAAAALGFAAAKLSKTLLDAAIAASRSTAAILEEAAAQQASRAATIAKAQANIQKIESEIAALAATKAGIAAAREQYVAELQLINAFRARGLTMAQAGAVTTELATLGRQQAAVTAQQTAATAALTAAQKALATAQGAAGATASLASRALGLLGGPIVVITTVLGLGVTAWAMWGGASKDAEQKATDAVERSTQEIVADLDKQIAKLKERNSLAAAGLVGIAKQESEAAKKMATLQGQIDNLMNGKSADGGAAPPEAVRVELLQVLLRQYGTLADKIQAVNAEQTKLDAAGSASKLQEWMLKYANNAEKAREEIAKAKKELGSAFTPELEQRIVQKYTDKKSPKEKFDAAGYMAGLTQQVANPFEQVEAWQQEALRKNDELLKKGNISRQQAAQAAFLIEQEAAERRLDLLVKDGAERAQAIETVRAAEREEAKKQDELDRKAEEERKRGRALAQDVIGDADPITKLQQELNEKSELLLQAYMRDKANEELYAQARVALEQQTAEKIRAIREQQQQAQAAQQSAQLQAYGQLFEGIAGLTQSFAGKQSGIFKAMFAVSKAFAIADAIVKIQQGIASAAAMPFPANIPAMASVAAATAGIVSTIRGTNYGGGRQYGGPVDAGSMYRVGEGNRPEMFVGDSGRSYMIPGERGKVIGNGDLGGQSLAPIVNIYEAPAGATTRSSKDSDGRWIVDVMLTAVAEDMATGGKVSRATQGRFNLRA